jgi:hypothetical protein
MPENFKLLNYGKFVAFSEQELDEFSENLLS